MSSSNLFSREAEDTLVGSLMIDPMLAEEIDTTPDELYLEKNRLILTAIRNLQDKGELAQANVISIAEELKSIDGGEQVGGVGELALLTAATPNAYYIATAAEIIRKHSKRRSVIDAAQKLGQAAFDERADLTSAISQTVDELIRHSGSKIGSVPVRDVSKIILDEIELAYANPSDYYGIPTGMNAFDKITAGFQRGEVTMLAGEPGVGKSSLAMQWCVGMARGAYGIPGTPGVVYQLEMSAKATWRRVLALRAGVTTRQMRSGRIDEQELSRLLKRASELSELPIYITDRSDWTTIGLRADIARLKLEHNIGWVLIDYMALLQDEPHLDNTERSGLISDRVHHLAKDLDVAVLAVHEMTKAGITGDITGQAALAGSRRVSYNADMSLVLKSKNQDDKSQLILEWIKFREDANNRAIELERVEGQAAFNEVRNA